MPFRPDHAVIVAFLPASLLLADLFISPLESRAAAPLRWLARGAFVLLLGLLLYWGVRDTRQVINPITILATEADLAALEWIEANTPKDALFFVNAVHWQGGSYRGVDGGWWIMPLTGRKTSLPPALYIQGQPDWAIQINDRAARAARLQGCSEDFHRLIAEVGATYIYVKEGVGALSPASLQDCPGILPIYEREGVHIYAVVRL